MLLKDEHRGRIASRSGRMPLIVWPFVAVALMATVCRSPVLGQQRTRISQNLEIFEVIERSARARTKFDFQINGVVGFVSSAEGVIHVQQQRQVDGKTIVHAISFRFEPELLDVAAELQPGANVRIGGTSHPHLPENEGRWIDVVDERAGLEPRDAALQFGANMAPLNSFVRATGDVRQVLIRDAQAFLSIATEQNSVVVEIHRNFEAEPLKDLVGKRVMVCGTLGLTVRNDPLIYVMDGSQVKSVPRANEPSANIDSVYAEIEGRVLYSDSRDTITVSVMDGDDIYVLSTVLASSIQAGDSFVAYCEIGETDDTYVTRVRRGLVRWIEVNGIEPLEPVEELADFKTLTFGKQIPLRIKLEVQVLSAEVNNGICELTVGDSDAPIYARVHPSAMPGGPVFSKGDQVLLTGAHLWKKPGSTDSVRHRVDSELWLYVAGADSAVVVSRYLNVDPEHLLWIVGAAVIVFLIVVLWTYSLRHQVSIRTERLNALTSHLATSFEAAREGILLNDQHAVISRINDRFCEMFGMDVKEGDIARERLKELAPQFDDPQAFRDFCDRMLSIGSARETIELQLGNRTLLIYGSPIFDANFKRLGNFWTFEDITEERGLEQRFLQAQKMDAVGQLSGGIAHDFNNLLTVISSNVALMEHYSEGSKNKVSGFCSSVETAVRQAAELTQQLLDFSRRSTLHIRTVDANELVERVYNFLRRTIDSTFDVSLSVSTEKLPIAVDVTRIEQALINLSINARDAIADGHGSISLRVRNSQRERFPNHVIIEVEDTGSGMPPEIEAKIFEPFFTTKKRGKGTGLGLSTVFGVIEKHGAEIEVRSEVGVGTCFTIYIELAEGNAEAMTDIPHELTKTDSVLRILLVDDEQMLRDTGRQILETLGHDVVTASDGQQAIEELDRDSRFDAVLLDMTMPVMTGKEAYHIIRERWPQLPVAICSGYSQDQMTVPEEEEEGASVSFLPKPFRIKDLRAILDRVSESLSHD